MAKLVVALDVPGSKEALQLAGSLCGHAEWLKIGLRLFTGSGPFIVRKLREEGFKIFLDLKFYDIPNTVAEAVAAACELGVDMLTIHCQGGKKMCKVALDAASAWGNAPFIFGVTALTSFANGEMPGIGKAVSDFAFELAADAAQWGLNGVVCSGHEAEAIKRDFPALLCLCPGIRPSGSGRGDQSRIMTPAKAVKAGADFLVVGRPIIQAGDPARAAAAIIAEMREATIK